LDSGSGSGGLNLDFTREIVVDLAALEQLRRQLIEVQRRVLGRPQPRRSAGAHAHRDESSNADNDPFQQLQSLLDQSAQRCAD
jgi:hypothetical protein